MQKIEIKIEDTRYQSGTLYTTSPKFFLKYYLCNEVEECGICLSGEAISRVGQIAQQEALTNIKVEKPEDRLIPFPTAKEAVNKYKTALKVIDIEDASKMYSLRQMVDWIKSDVISLNTASFVAYGILWMASDKSLSYSAWLATLCLLCNLNLDEVLRAFKTTFVSYNKRKSMEDEVTNMGLGELVSEPIQREELKLYMKVKDGNFRFK